MASTNFISKQTVIPAEWLNEVDALVHDVFSGATTDSEARTNLGLGDLAVENTVPISKGGTGSTTASGARTALGLAIGTDVQAYDDGLQSISGLTTSADQMIYLTGSDTYATTSLTSFARTILDDADASTVRTTLGLVIGTDVQAFDANNAFTDQIQSFTTPQRAESVDDNDGNFDMDAAQNFNATPTGDITLQFTNVTAGQSGIINLDNSGGHAISIDTATILAGETAAEDLSATGEFMIGYHVPNGESKARISYTGALS